MPGDSNTHNSHKINSGKKSDNSTDIISAAASSGDITLGDSGVTAGTYKRVTVNAKGIVVGGDNTDADTHYTKYLQIKGNGTEAVKFTQNADKTLNLKPGTNVSISAASGEITINAEDT
jgi:phage-related tail fiber protein